MPPSIEDIQQHLKDAINWHSDFVGCLREALAKVLAFEPYPGNGAAPEDEPLVTSRPEHASAPGIYEHVKRPRRSSKPKGACGGDWKTTMTRYRPPFPPVLQDHEIHSALNDRRYSLTGMITLYDLEENQLGRDQAASATYQWDERARAYVDIARREERDAT